MPLVFGTPTPAWRRYVQPTFARCWVREAAPGKTASPREDNGEGGRRPHGLELRASRDSTDEAHPSMTRAETTKTHTHTHSPRGSRENDAVHTAVTPQRVETHVSG